MKQLKAAVVGCGNISQRHLNAISENEHATVAAVCDIIRERADSAAEQCGAKAFYAFNDMLDRGAFDVLHICTPHYLHAEMAMGAMRNGKHVLCEKPLAIHYEDALNMCQCAKENAVYLGVCFQNRYNPSSEYIRNLLKSDELGKIRALKGIVTWDRDEDYYNADDWHGTLKKEGGGVVINQAIHTLDLLQWFADADIAEVYGSISQKRLMGKVETEDTADALIKFSDGASALFYGSLCYHGNSPVFLEIKCDNGKIVMYDDIHVFRNDKETETVTFKNESGKKSYWGNSHKLLISDFYDSIINNKPFPVSGESGLNAVKIVDVLYKNARNSSIYLDNK